MTETLPLFPLGTVLLPGASLPLHIFEPRYRQLTVDLVTGVLPDRQFGVVSIREGWEIGTDNVGSLREIGCTALLREARRLNDGRFDIVTKGERRFKLLSVDHKAAPYLVGEVEWLPDTPTPPPVADVLPLMAKSARAAHQRYCAAAWHREDWSAPPEETTHDLLSYLLAGDCLLALEDKQHLLEETSPARRLHLIRRLLHLEAGILDALHAVPVPLSEFGHASNPN
ncbi:LON peptidase substrate-binding domain-containing protein [Umezawaea sp. Da 62-37]|uniref:LON peptidase substrate-binding domain-containing protein n=1 Tax=Umezawaea sp. Da 62-37 TaxID=3075927 RepID=UPI0028F6EEF7|nr:LON peptidase substrate-binding domain-containing protein [Umezawaea sp. Da 62-37]WNV89690.1 LON peptidase substrate-binding domain-containing protein [Umezawaea sp. Da 62-37]